MDLVHSFPVFPDLFKTAFTYPAIDNHAHPILRAEYREKMPFEGLISEADGDALTKDAVTTLACLRATPQLARLYNVPGASWDEVKLTRAKLDYLDLCKKSMEPTGIQCILLDDGLGGVEELAEDIKWHNQFTSSPSRRISRVEIVAEGILKGLLEQSTDLSTINIDTLLDAFTQKLTDILMVTASDPLVAGFKSIACYRTGLNVSTWDDPSDIKTSLLDIVKMYRHKKKIRLAHKAFNDHTVRIALEVAGKHGKPIQFHTGLGDNDIDLRTSSPSHLQPVIKAFPNTSFVLLHSSYPYTRDAGYLTAVYPNVFLDFGEVFPFVSGHGQRSIIRQVLELAPTNKIMWSTDGHWWPESYYLGTMQARKALFDVLSEIIAFGELTELEAVAIVQNALFHNANKVYNLGLEPHLSPPIRNVSY